MSVFKEARDKGCEYLLRQLREDGSFGDGTVDEYYKVPAAFQVCGETNAANRLCDWIRKNGMGADGDFGPRTDFTSDYFYAYFNIWVILGAQRLGQFDIVQRGMDFLMDFYDEESGGFYSSRTERSPATKQDLWVVSGCGQAALYASRLDVARGVGRWMQRMMDEQPNYPEVMYTVMTPAGGLVTDVDPDDPIRYVLVNAEEGDQYFFHPGIAGGFLARLYQSTGEAQWLELAKRYMLFAETATDNLMRLLRAGKVAWAASVLFTLTGGAEVPRPGRRGREQHRRATVAGGMVGVRRIGRPQQRRDGRDGRLARRGLSVGGVGRHAAMPFRASSIELTMWRYSSRTALLVSTVGLDTSR